MTSRLLSRLKPTPPPTLTPEQSKLVVGWQWAQKKILDASAHAKGRVIENPALWDQWRDAQSAVAAAGLNPADYLLKRKEAVMEAE